MSGPSGSQFAVKLLNNPQKRRILFNELATGRLAAILGLACPSVDVVDVSPEAAEGVDFGGERGEPGPGHGSQWLPNVDPVSDLTRALTLPDNVERFTGFMVLYSITGNSDAQWLQETVSPFGIYSVDHGHCFLGDTWDADKLANAPELTEVMTHGQALDTEELFAHRARLAALTPEDVAWTVRCVPGSWHVSLADRVAAASFLWLRIHAVKNLIQVEGESGAS